MEDDAVLVLGIRGRARYSSSCPKTTKQPSCSTIASGLESTRSCERVRRTSAIIASPRGCLTRREITLFSPPSLYVSLWSYGPLNGSFPERSLRPSQGGRQVPHVMSQQPALRHSWITMVASSFWDMRLSIACACRAPEPHHPPRQHPQPPRRGSAAPSGPQLRVVRGGAPRCRRLDGQPWRVVVSIQGARSSMRPLAVRHLNSRSS